MIKYISPGKRVGCTLSKTHQENTTCSAVRLSRSAVQREAELGRATIRFLFRNGPLPKLRLRHTVNHWPEEPFHRTVIRLPTGRAREGVEADWSQRPHDQPLQLWLRYHFFYRE